MKEGQRNAIHKIDACMASPEQLPFVLKVEIQPSEVDTHILAPPKLMSKDGVLVLTERGSITNEKLSL